MRICIANKHKQILKFFPEIDYVQQRYIVLEYRVEYMVWIPQ